MKIKRFNEEITYLPVLDLVIDKNGEVKYRDEIPVKGEVRRVNGVIREIRGKDGMDYVAGINKSGRLEICREYSDNNNISVKGVILLDSNLEPWDINKNYKNILYKRPTGWVNSKIDMEVHRRVSRFVSSVELPSNRNTSFTQFIYRLRQLEIASNIKRGQTAANKLSRSHVQSQLSMITLLNYMDEIKLHFTPTSSGLIFESYIAGFIPNSNVEDDNGSSDIIADNKSYQIKLYGNNNNIDVVKNSENNYLDYYIISIKSINKIDIFIIKTKGDKGDLPSIFDIDDSILTPGGAKHQKRNFSMVNVKNLNSNYLSKFKINLENIDGKIKNLGKNLKESIGEIYKSISELQYNIEALSTGVDEDGKRITNIKNLDKHFNDSNSNIESIKKNISVLFDDIKNRK